MPACSACGTREFDPEIWKHIPPPIAKYIVDACRRRVISITESHPPDDFGIGIGGRSARTINIREFIGPHVDGVTEKYVSRDTKTEPETLRYRCSYSCGQKHGAEVWFNTRDGRPSEISIYRKGVICSFGERTGTIARSIGAEDRLIWHAVSRERAEAFDAAEKRKMDRANNIMMEGETSCDKRRRLDRSHLEE